MFGTSWDLIASKMMKILTFAAIVLYLVYKSAKPTIQRFYFVPPNDFRDVIQAATESNNGLLKKGRVGIKAASLRRRLIMGSKQPLLYSTLPLNDQTPDDLQLDKNDDKYYRLRVMKKDRDDKETFLKNIRPIESTNVDRRKLFGFFHPFSYTGGGGEKVLWEAVVSTLESDSNNVVVIYTFTGSSTVSAYSMLDNVKKHFGIDFLTQEREELRNRIVFIHLPEKYQWLIKGESYKFLSIAGQAIGSIILVLIGFQQLVPDVYIDTIGIPFTYFMVRALFGLPIMSYIHYPTVNRDTVKNASLMKGIRWILKYYYSLTLLALYAFNLMWSDITLFNSTWTAENVKNAVESFFNYEDVDDQILYPPCISYDDVSFDTVDVEKMIESKKEKYITYLAQFRPEKRHFLLISEYKKYIDTVEKDDAYTLVLIGSNADKKYSTELVDYAKKIGFPRDKVLFVFNATNEEVENWLTRAEFGVNCMWKEHFGIAVVEYMLHGQIPIVHASAGPLTDIVVPRVEGKTLNAKEMRMLVRVNDEDRSGFFFKDKSDPDYEVTNTTYPTLTEVLVQATTSSVEEKLIMKRNSILVARERFGRGTFSSKWKQYVYEATQLEQSIRALRGKVEAAY